MWFPFAVLSAFFASMTSILVKIGINGINSNLATAIRTAVVLVMAWAIVFITGAQHGINTISRNSMIFLILSGIATGLSWLCYYWALQLGQVSKVLAVDKFSIVMTIIIAAIFLNESLTTKTVMGGILITLGTLVMIS